MQKPGGGISRQAVQSLIKKNAKDHYVLEFGVSTLAGSGANPRFLWAGSGRTIAQPEEIGFRVPFRCMLRNLFLRQNRPPAAGAASLTYEVLRNGVGTGATLVIAVTDMDASSVGINLVNFSAGDYLSVAVTRDQDHASVLDVTLTAALEV